MVSALLLAWLDREIQMHDPDEVLQPVEAGLSWVVCPGPAPGPELLSELQPFEGARRVVMGVERRELINAPQLSGSCFKASL